MTARRFVWLLPLFCAAYAVWAGRDANWDLLNYHYYNVHAWLNGRENLDFAVGQLQTLFNPLLHLPMYLGMESLDPRVYAALLGAVQGLNLILVWSIACAVWPAEAPLRRSGPLLVAVVAGFGAGFRTQLGTSFGDTIVTLPLLGALLLILTSGETKHGRILVAGVLGGIACGLKPLNAAYAVALAASVLCMPGVIRTRASRLASLALGGIAGVAISGGWWYWEVWQRTGNPVFPYYNDVFRSPLYWNERFVFATFLPRGWLEALLYPWLWLANPTRVSEVPFLSLAIPALTTLLVAAGIARFLGLRPQGEADHTMRTRALLVFWIAGYVLWLTQSSVYRFAVLLEMLAPLLVALLLVRWMPASVAHTRVVLALLVLAVVNRPANFGRYPYAGHVMKTNAVRVPPNAMVAIAGWSPLSYMVAAFPERTPLVRIQSNMHGFVERPNGLDAEARRRLEKHDGPLLLLVAEEEWHIAQPLLDHYHYRVDRASCRTVDGTLRGGGGISPLALCTLSVR